jgi:HK97 family phage major capsid protein
MGLITLPASITNLAEKIVADLSDGRAARQNLGDGKAAAFGWTEGLPPTLAQYVASAETPGLRFDYVTVTATATPAGKVAEGAPKPAGVVFTPGTETLDKFAGYAEWSLEQDLNTSALAGAVYQVLAGQCLMAYEADLMALVSGAATLAGTGTTWAAALLDAQAQVLGAGGRPGVFVVSSQDYAELMTENAGAGGFAMFADPESGPLGQRLFGSAVHVSPGLPAGPGYLLDPTAVVAVEHQVSPVVTVDPYSLATTNKIRLVVDLVAGGAATAPGLIATVTKTIA